jgi:hypothetical protein
MVQTPSQPNRHWQRYAEDWKAMDEGNDIIPGSFQVAGDQQKGCGTLYQTLS